MIDIGVYISSLKLSWIRRFFQSNAKWQSPMNRILNRHPFLWDTGTLYKKTILQDPHNNFFGKKFLICGTYMLITLYRSPPLIF